MVPEVPVNYRPLEYTEGYIILCFNKNLKILWQKESATTVTKKVTDVMPVMVL
jgi:hypothetical protein